MAAKLSLAELLADCLAATGRKAAVQIPQLGTISLDLIARDAAGEDADPSQPDDWVARVSLDPESVDPEATAVPRSGVLTFAEWLVRAGGMRGEVAIVESEKFAAALRKRLVAGDIIELPSLGVLALLSTAEELTRHPKTHAWMRVPPRRHAVLELDFGFKQRLSAAKKITG